MFVISRNGHLGFTWDGNMPLYVEEETSVFPHRSDCLEYLMKFYTKERAVEIIVLLQKSKNSVLSF